MRFESTAIDRLLFLMVLFVFTGMACTDNNSNTGTVNDNDAGSSNTTSTSNGTTGTGGMDAGQDTEPEDTSVEDEPEEDVVDEEQVVACEPNTIIRCLVENTPAVEQCSFRGDAIITTTCQGRAVCREGECIDVECIPGTRVCQDDLVPLICNEAGTERVAQDACTDGSICSEGACLDPCEIAREQSSYTGCEYWPVELDNFLLYDDDPTSTPESPFAVVLSNPNAEPTRVSVYMPNGDFLDAITEVYIPVGLQDPRFTSTTVYTEVINKDGERVGEPLEGPLDSIELMPDSQLQILFPRSGPTPLVSSITKTAWKIVSDRPVVAYQFNPICCNYSFTNDASLLLPKGALTENYRVMSYPTWTPSSDTSYPATLTVVATEDDTEVVLTVSDPRIREGENVPELDENGQMIVTLQAHEVLNIEASASTPEVDLTGSIVAANKPVAVFGAHVCTDIPYTLAACDHVEQQLFPSETWGKNYVVAPLKLRGDGRRTREGTYWKFLARKDNTEIVFARPFQDMDPLPQSAPGVDCTDKLTFENTLVLQEGEFCEFGTTEGFSFFSTQPVLMGAFLSGQASSGLEGNFGNFAGDPAFFLVSPQEQFRDNYAFITPVTFALDYVTVLASAGTRISLDGQLLDLTSFDHELIPSQNFIYAHIPLEDGPHKMVGDGPFGIVIYAYDDYVSYAYTGGLNLTKLSDVDEE